MKLVFYNHFGYGDLFESREFVRDWMRITGTTSAEYAHGRSPEIFADMPQLISVPLDNRMMLPQQGITRHQDSWLINTWIGRGWDGKKTGYVLNPGVGCVVENIYWMHNDLLKECQLPPLPRSVSEYLPVVDYSRLSLNPVHQWLTQHGNKRLILVCNGPTSSHHASNFDFSCLLDGFKPEPAKRLFLFTHPLKTNPRPDVFWTNDITRRKDCDLLSISYLSTFCSVIAGRCSGPHVAAQTLPNWMDSRKTLVCFTHERNGACFVRYPEKAGLKMNVLHSTATTPDAINAVFEPLIHPETVSLPKLKVAKPVPLIHVWSYAPNPADHTETLVRRLEIARKSWHEEAKTGLWLDHFIPPTSYHRHSGQYGDKRRLPFINDLFDHACQNSSDDAVIVFSNADISFAKGLTGMIQSALSSYPCLWSFRRDFVKLDRQLSREEIASGKFYQGSDLFAFHSYWWRTYRQKMPRMFLGAQSWDFILRNLMRLTGGTELENAIAHEKHNSYWEQPTHKKDLSNTHNLQAASRFLATHHLPWKDWIDPATISPVSAFIKKI